MSVLTLQIGSLKITVKYTVLKRGVWFYRRRIPKELQHHYPQPYRYESLKTQDPHQAAKLAAALAAKDDAFWQSLRSPEGQASGLTTRENTEGANALLKSLGLAPGDLNRDASQTVDALDAYMSRRYGTAYLESRHDPHVSQVRPVDSFYTPVEAEAVRLLSEGTTKHRPHLSEAVEAYLKQHAKGKQKKFIENTKRAVGHLESVAGDLPLDLYNRAHGRAVIEVLSAKGNKTATIRRRIAVLSAVFNIAIDELELRGLDNPFRRLKIPNLGLDKQRRVSFTKEELTTIAKDCVERDDDIRHLVAALSDTGARLSEIAGLRLEDVFLDHAVPHIWIRTHLKHGRSLKEETTERKVPLVGMALWGVTRAVKQSKALKRRDGWLFPRYANDEGVNGTAASNAIKKWLRNSLEISKTSHSFRHAMKDRLRLAKIPEEAHNRIGGWGRFTIPQGYGEGHELKQLQGYLEEVVIYRPE
ncbi:DUF6538 domain-containing protein [Microvirga sp. VF16]|uniref:DUF6538 domain-containing protein n=1 Tax=Microvirga sp. VF16 TaxID=2807101 RepID=UPI00193D129B|nr:DUF6538 domain-containing protein [Microvirga sp. VF16]QRM29563.1 tyrosine-type recombinase/integrase [Microvirga sp. VF16]